MPHPYLATNPACVVCCRARPGDFYPLDDTAADQWICPSCVFDLPRCHRCHGLARELVVAAEEQRLCRMCTSGLVACVSCRALTDPSLRTDTADIVCPRCAAVFFDRCFSCARYSDATRYLSGGYRVCPHCADGFRTCGDCGTLLRSGRSCDPCVRSDRVWNYSYKPDPHFHGAGPLFLGLELEVIVPEHSYSDCVALAAGELGGLGYLKQDSSIRPTGFE